MSLRDTTKGKEKTYYNLRNISSGTMSLRNCLQGFNKPNCENSTTEGTIIQGQFLRMKKRGQI